MSQTIGPGIRAAQGQAEYDALADLFLGDQAAPSNAPPQKKPTSDRAPHIEGLILGHLPVMASAWVQQYARQLCANRGELVALLRLRPGEAQLDLVGDATRQPRPTADLEEALSQAAASTRTWILRVDEVSEPQLAQSGIDALTLLTGADEAAVVSAYRTMKNLCRPDESGPDIRIAIMGAPADRASEAIERLETACRAFLGRPVHVEACSAKIGGTGSTVIYRGPSTKPVGEVLQAVRSAKAQAMSPRPAPQASHAPEPSAVVSRLGRAPGSPVESLPPIAPEVPPVLTGHIPGLRAIPARSPFSPRVELALDEANSLHLLGADEGQGATDLLAAAAWAKAHRALLSLAMRVPDHQGEPVVHLFTQDARRARPLLDTAVRVHLLVKAGQGGAWLCSPLN